MARRLLVAIWAVLSGCALGAPWILDHLREGEFERVVRTNEGLSAESAPFQRLGIAWFADREYPITPAITVQLSRCGERLKTRGLAAEVELLADSAPRCSRLRSVRRCAEQALETYRTAARERGHDGLLVTALLQGPRPWMPPVIRRGRAAAFPETVDPLYPEIEQRYITEGGILETGSGAVRAYARGVSEGVLQDVRGPPTGRLPQPPVDLVAQSVRRFCVDLEVELFGE